MATRDEFVQSIKKNIDNWNDEIAKMEKNIENAAEDGRAEYGKQLEKAKEYRDKAQEKLRESRDASTEQWEQMRGRMEGAMSDISEGFRNAWARMK